MRLIPVMVIILIGLNNIIAYSQSLEGLGDAAKRHPLQLPPKPPLVYTRYLNLSGEELGCISLGIAVYLSMVDLSWSNRFKVIESVGSGFKVEIGNYTVDPKSIEDIRYLSLLFYKLSFLLASDRDEEAETLLRNVIYKEVSSRLDSLGDALKLSAAWSYNESLPPTLISISPLAACLDNKPPEGYSVIDSNTASRIANKLLNREDLKDLAKSGKVDEVIYNLSIATTFYLTTFIGSSVLDKGYYIYAGEGASRGTSLNQLNTRSTQSTPLYIYKVPQCKGVNEVNKSIDRMACLVPNIFPTRIHLIPSLLISQRIKGDLWAFPLHGEEALNIYNTIDKLVKFADAYDTILNSGFKVSISVTPTREEADINISSNIQPINLEQEINDILRERRMRDYIKHPPPNPSEEANGEVRVSGSIIDIAKARLGDFTSILKSIYSIRDRLNSTVLPNIGVPKSSVFPGSNNGLGFSLPNINPLILILPLAVFIGYMGRESIYLALNYMRGLAGRRIKRGAPEPVVCYESILKATEKYGVVKGYSETPREFLYRASPMLPEWLRKGLDSATRAYEEYKYAGSEPSRRDLDECWNSVRRSILPWRSRKR